jgi:hypothetical protein
MLIVASFANEEDFHAAFYEGKVMLRNSSLWLITDKFKNTLI